MNLKEIWAKYECNGFCAECQEDGGLCNEAKEYWTNKSFTSFSTFGECFSHYSAKLASN